MEKKTEIIKLQVCEVRVFIDVVREAVIALGLADAKIEFGGPDFVEKVLKQSVLQIQCCTLKSFNLKIN